MNTGFSHICWQDNALHLLDQRKLPLEEVMVVCDSVSAVIAAIKDMVVRGAPAIGVTAAYGALLSVMAHVQKNNWKELVVQDLDALAQARPTAVNLMWAVDEMKSLLDGSTQSSVIEDVSCLANKIHQDDIENNQLMAGFACELLNESSEQPFSMITHCNTGTLATGGYGTALGVIRKAWEQGMLDRVYADETRPWLQGARLTAWELSKDQIPVTLNADGAASWLMAEKNIKWAVVGADRIAANGDVANKIGTYALAIQARYHGVKFMVVAPSSTVDMSVSSGRDIEIEMRTANELTNFTGQRVAPEDVDVINPVFDVTPASLIDAIVTEKGVIVSPNTEAMTKLFK